jgi:hypothetical protein
MFFGGLECVGNSFAYVTMSQPGFEPPPYSAFGGRPTLPKKSNSLLVCYLEPLENFCFYEICLQEVEQHLEDDHVDRGDTQRSIAFYKVRAH